MHVRPGFLVTAALATIQVSIATAAVVLSPSDGGFHSSCVNDNIEIRAGAMFLFADCQDSDQAQLRTEIDLSKCLQNVNGQLKCALNGGFYSTCEYDSYTTYQDATLSMYCRNGTGSLLWSSYDLSKLSRTGVTLDVLLPLTRF